MAPRRPGTSFPVDQVTPGSPRGKGIAARRAFESLLGRTGHPIETCQPCEERLIPCSFNGFAAAVHLAHAVHAPLTIAPDHVWLVIAQGLAAHLHLDPGCCRGRFVRYGSHPVLQKRDDELMPHAAADEWAGVWDDIIRLLESESPQLVELLTQHFSTTGRSERLAYAVTAMDVFEPCFEARVRTLGGIPSITLEGTTDDWLAVRERAEHLRAFGLPWWLDALLPVLDQLVAASRGDVDPAWWRGFYHDTGASGGSFITGHIRAFFPYVCLREQRLIRRIDRQPLDSPERMAGRVLTSDVLPSGLAQVPFTWRTRGVDVPMSLVAGFVGICEDPGTATLRPEVGWAVREAETSAVALVGDRL